MAPLMAASVASVWMISPNSPMTSPVSVFMERPGTSKVMSAMPRSSMATVKLFMGNPQELERPSQRIFFF